MKQPPLVAAPDGPERRSGSGSDVHLRPGVAIELLQLLQLAQDRLAAGDVAAGRELERMASQSEAALEAARAQWEAKYGKVHHEAEADREGER